MTFMKSILSSLMGFISILLQGTLVILWCAGLGFFAFKMAQSFSWGHTFNALVYIGSLVTLFTAGLMVWWQGSKGLIGVWNDAELRLNQKWFGKAW